MTPLLEPSEGRARETALATVLFVDIVGSTERLTELGDRAWRQLLGKYLAHVRRELRRCGGREMNTAGDSVLATFDHPARAIRCAWSIRESVRDLGIEVRCGVHVGEVEGSGPSVSGIAVHVADRVAGAAGPGEILLTSTVRDLLAGARFDFEDRGLHELKGIEGPWRLFAARELPAPATDEDRVPSGWRATLTSRPTLMRAALAAALLLGIAGVFRVVRERSRVMTATEANATAALPGLAVLPFEVNGPGLGDWREGMVDLLSTNLDGVAGVRAIDSRTVLARSREMAPRGGGPDLDTSLGIARRTGARYAVVGGAVAIGSRVRLSAELHDLTTGLKLGATRVDGVPDSIFQLVDRLSLDLVALLSSERDGFTPTVSLSRATTDSLSALKAYLQGEALLRRSDFEGAIRAYERAVEIDSTFALALHRLNVAVGWFGAEDARPYAERAYRYADRLPERQRILLQGSLALGRGTLDGIDLLRDAVRRYPDQAEAWFELGEMYYHFGPQALIERTEADRAFSRVVEIDPTFSPAYDHLIENAFGLYADSARAAGWIAAHHRASGDVPTVHWARIAFGLAFGGPAAQREARAGLASLTPPDRVRLARNFLWHPRFLPLQAEIFGGSDEPAYAFANDFARGFIERAAGVLSRPDLPDAFVLSRLYTLHAWGMPVSREVLDREFAARRDTTLVASLYRGAYAVDRRRWSAHAAELARVEAGASARLAAGDTLAARFADGLALALKGYAQWRRGRRDEGLTLLEAARRQATGWGERAEANVTIRTWLARLALELDREAEAEAYLRSFWREWGEPREPLARYELAPLQQARGDAPAARASYDYFVVAWRDADPGLRPRVQHALRALAR